MKPLWERVLSKVEVIGYRASNVVHKTAVTGLILFSGYSLFAVFREYRSYFLLRKDPQYSEYLKDREKVLKDLIESKDKQ
jgi:hypothetical protein